MQTAAPRNPLAPRPPLIPELVALPDPEGDEKPEPLFVPDPDLAAWVETHFFGPDSPLLIEDHGDLVGARIGYLWTNVVLRKGRRQKGGTAQLGRPNPHMGDAWIRGEIEQVRRIMFDGLPDLLVTLYAPDCARCEGYQLLALIDHELCHFRQDEDKDGEPRFDEETGRPVYVTVGHDVEEFVGVCHRWGPRSRDLANLRGALSHRPYMDVEIANRLVGPPTVRGDSWPP